jgi:hypothetical protein
LLISIGSLLVARPAIADVVTLPASKDNTLYEDGAGSLSNGAGQFIFAGKTNVNTIRRALIAFDVAGAIPSGSTITSATLALNMSITISQGVPVTLLRARADWGEAESQAPGLEGAGGQAAPGDATWLHTFHDTAFWPQPGGDFTAVPSATTIVNQIGPYTWGSTAQMVADVQSWLDAPAGNFGWLLLADESTLATAKRFDSRQHLDPGVRPALRVEFTPPASGAGRVPDGGPTPGTPLTVDHALGGDLALRWGASCAAGDTDYEVYEGRLGNFTSHVPRACTTTGQTFLTLTPAAVSSYYLVVPVKGSREGSYGLTSSLAERPTSGAACLSQAVAACF